MPASFFIFPALPFVIIVIYNKKMYVGSVRAPGTRLLKSLEFPK